MNEMTADERGELRGVVKSIRAEWRDKLSAASRLSPNSKLAKKAGVLLLDMQILEDRIAEAGGEEELIFVICAQVASGVTLTDWCAHYVLERGLVWAFLTEKEEWFERYQRALRGVADHLVSEVVAIADDSSGDTTVGPRGGEVMDTEYVARSKIKIDTRMKLAGYYDKTRFGRDSDTSSAVTANLPASIQITFVDAFNGRPVIEAETA